MRTTAQHVCPAPGCGTRVPDYRFACRTHWWALSEGARRAILATRSPSASAGERALIGAAQARAVRELRAQSAKARADDERRAHTVRQLAERLPR